MICCTNDLIVVYFKINKEKLVSRMLFVFQTSGCKKSGILITLISEISLLSHINHTVSYFKGASFIFWVMFCHHLQSFTHIYRRLHSYIIRCILFATKSAIVAGCWWLMPFVMVYIISWSGMWYLY